MILKLDAISKSYKDKEALRDFSATLKEGVYGLLGQNGAGKTTLINVITGILNPDEGKVFFNDVDVKKMGVDFVSKIGYLPQFPQFYKNFEALEFLRYICAIKDVPEKTGEKRIKELLEMVNLSDVADKKIGTFSGGMRQRLGIAQAMVNDPEILILDEPTAGLDPKERIRFRNLISKFSKDRIVLLATHIVSDVEYIANEVILLQKGILIKQDKPMSLIDEMRGKVWEVKVDTANNQEFLDKFSISNIVFNEGHYSIRVVSEQKPVEGASSISPNLEDVFLHYCETGDGK
ncbi:ABC transporter ATP-binding protein [Tissierella pigra]|uniref:ABC transporter ATP-binding protein n=1 Tax=Tissierella pigra TaxID=2607614 RepID=A0A6N7Y4A9_9FIRM|nr:ABC transporter ATP-binding protein [Tissierella pigra]MBU5426898.1 ABC transporter ATP-binding protein [Tissierella pigra]MSU03288.1 ABC transporter ATP-binding protein [Tissierella pigra]